MGPRATGPDDQDGEHSLAGKCSFANLVKEEMEGTAASARHEWKVQYVTTELGGTSRRIQETNEVKVAPGTGVVTDLSSSSKGSRCGERRSAPHTRNTKNGCSRKVAEFARPCRESTLCTMMRMEELSWETSEAADVCAQGDLGQVASLFDLLFGI